MFLSVFPDLLFLAPFSALLVRVALAILFAHWAWKHVRETDIVLRAMGVIEGALAVALFVGAWTQPAALISFVLISSWFFTPRFRSAPMSTALLALVMCATLLITGAGPLAFDLPL